jgi:uncharacterized protein
MASARPSALLLDAGPLVALLNRRDQHHEWARLTLDAAEVPLLTTESVLSEAWFLTGRGGADPIRVLDLVRLLEVEVVTAWSPRAERLLRDYPERGSIADASLLALVEEDDRRKVVTTDRADFSVYRIHRRRSVPALMPPTERGA